jgi:hypothetical protein
MSTAGAAFLSLLVLAALVVGSWALWGYGVASRAVTGVTERTLDPDNIINNYEWYKQEYQQIKAFDAQIAIARQTVKDAEAIPVKERDFRDKEELARVRTILQGLENQRQSRVGEYNARARMANRNIFMGSDVPTQLAVQDDKTVAVSQ